MTARDDLQANDLLALAVNRHEAGTSAGAPSVGETALAENANSSTMGLSLCGVGAMPKLTRITRDPGVMGGKPCIRGMRVTVGTVVGLIAAGRTRDEILREYPYLEPEDIAEALSYAAWRAEEVEVPLRQP